MQAYSELNALLVSPLSTYQAFQMSLKSHGITQETYLNLFLTAVASEKANHPDFPKYVYLLTHFRDITGKNSADINYLGYKDRVSILMHACARGNILSITTLLGYKNIDIMATDPYGRNCAFYAIKNSSQETTNSILGLLLQHSSNLIFVEAANGYCLLNEAIQYRKAATFEFLLRKGANLNSKLKNNGNSVAHQLVKLYGTHKEMVNKLIGLLLKYRANFELTNVQGKTVYETAKEVGLNLQDCVSFCNLLEREESVTDQADVQFDKQSITTFNQQTKIGDSASQMFQLQSNVCSHQVDFSGLDYQQDTEIDPPTSQTLINQIDVSSQESQEEDCSQSQQQKMNFQTLSKQMIDYSTICEEAHRQAWIVIEPFFRVLQRIARRFGLYFQLVGSFATGLWSSYSDIDINFIPLSTDYMNFESVLEQIFKKLKNRRIQLGIQDVYLNKSKINSIKLQMGPTYNNHAIEIAIFHRNNQNRNYVAYIVQAMQICPQIKPLFFVFRKLCQTFNLHDQMNGGLKTFTLFLMINNVAKSMPTANPGQLLYQIALYFGFYFQYACQFPQTQDSSKQDLQLIDYPAMRFNLVDPLNPKNNMGGKNTRARQLQNMFRSLYYCVSQLSSQPYLQQLFELYNIF